MDLVAIDGAGGRERGVGRAKTCRGEIAEIEKLMLGRSTEYSKDEVKSCRLRELYQIGIEHEKVA